MTDEEYIKLYNEATTDLVRLFPDGRMPDSDAARNAAVEILRQKRIAFETLAMTARIQSQATFGLEAEICKALSDEQIADLRRRDKSNEIRKIESVKEKKEDALSKMIAAGFSEVDARALLKTAEAGKR